MVGSRPIYWCDWDRTEYLSFQQVGVVDEERVHYGWLIWKSDWSADWNSKDTEGEMCWKKSITALLITAAGDCIRLHWDSQTKLD